MSISIVLVRSSKESSNYTFSQVHQNTTGKIHWCTYTCYKINKATNTSLWIQLYLRCDILGPVSQVQYSYTEDISPYSRCFVVNVCEWYEMSGQDDLPIPLCSSIHSQVRYNTMCDVRCTQYLGIYNCPNHTSCVSNSNYRYDDPA